MKALLNCDADPAAKLHCTLGLVGYCRLWGNFVLLGVVLAGVDVRQDLPRMPSKMPA